MSSNIGDNRDNNRGNISAENSNDNNNVNSTKKETPSLKVAEAEQRDVGRKIVRIDPKIAERLNISTGDALELSSLGKKNTVLSWPAKDTDRGKGFNSYRWLYKKQA